MANVRIKDLPKNTNVTPDSYLLVEAKNPDGTYSTVKVYIADAIISSGTSVVGNVDSTITASATAANSTTRLSAANIVRGNNSTAFGYSNIVPGDNSGILGGRNNFTGVDGLGAPLSGVFILGNSISAVEPNTTYIENLDVNGAQFVHGYSYFYGPVYTLEYSSDEWNTTYATVSALSASWIGGGSSEGYVNSNFLNLTGGIISGPVRINNDLTVFGNLTAKGTTTFANTIFSVTSALSVVHIGSGPALYVSNNGDGDIASFYDLDQGIEVFHVGGNNGSFPNVGVKTSKPNVDFTVNGQISANNIIWSAGGNSNNWNSAFNTATAYQNASGSFATNTLLQSTSALLTPLTLTRTLTSQLVKTTELNSLSAGWGSSNNTALLSLTGNWQSTFNTVSSLSAGWGSSINTSLFLPISGGILTGALSATSLSATYVYANTLSANSLSANNIYGTGNETVISDGLGVNDIGNGFNTLSLNFTNGTYVGGNGVLAAPTISVTSLTATSLSAQTLSAGLIVANSIPVYSYLTASGGTIGGLGTGVLHNYGFPSFVLAANGVYELLYDIWYTKTTAGTVTYTLTSNNTFASVAGEVVQTIATGVLTYSSPLKSFFVNHVGPLASFVATTSLTTAVNHSAAIRYLIRVGSSNSTVSLGLSASAGTVTPLSNSFAKLTRIA